MHKLRLLPGIIGIFLSLLTITGCVSHSFSVVRPSLEIPSEQVSIARAQEYFIQARDFERRGQDFTAIRYYEMAYELDPNSIILRNEVIRKYIETEKYTQALVLAKGNKNNNDLDRDTKRIVSTIYLKMGKLEKSAEVLRSITQKSEDEIYSLGLIYESMGKIDDALDYYLQFYAMQTDAYQIGFKIGKLLISQKRFSGADSLFESMKEKMGETPEILVMMGTSKIYNKDTTAGIQLFQSALTIDSLHEDALRSIAQVYMSRNDFQNAINCYQKLYKSTAYGQIYAKTLALLYYYNKQYEDSEVLLKSMLETQIDDYEIHYYLGLVFSAQKKYDLAQNELEKVLYLKDDFTDAWKELCYIQIRQKDYDAAMMVADRFLAKLSNETMAWQLQGMIFNLKKQYDKAIPSLQKSIMLDSSNAFSWFELGSSFERIKAIDFAVTAFKMVLKLHPHDPAASNYLGYMWAEKAINLDSAMVLLQTALKQEPDNGAYLDSYAWIFFQKKDYDSAYFYIQKAVDKIKDDPTIYNHLGDILEKKGDLKAAVKAYKKSLELEYEIPEEIEQKISEIELLLKQNEKK